MAMRTRRRRGPPGAFLLLLCCGLRAELAGGAVTLWFVTGEPQNDLLGLLLASPPAAAHVRNASLAEALARAASGDALLLLAGGYPWQRTDVPATLLGRAAALDLRLYLEFPETLPGFVPAPAAGCVNATPGNNTLVASFPTHVRSLCACKGGATASTIELTGSACGAGGKSVIWNAIRNLDPCADCNGKQCTWSRATEPPAWSHEWLGDCGVAPSKLPSLPMQRCGTG
eukprot:COSAG01_NODE_20643_length_943_cov_1.350711_1_plen_228_part_01